MQVTESRLYFLDFSKARTYIISALFVLGNIALPQICHLMPQGGLIFLPIYFFTLIAAYKYGWKVGLITAILSPLINNMLFGMPATSALPTILTKSIILAFAAGYTANYFKRTTIFTISLVVISYQLLGSLAEWGITKSLTAAVQDFKIGIPGIMLQIAGGFLIIKYLLKR